MFIGIGIGFISETEPMGKSKRWKTNMCILKTNTDWNCYRGTSIWESLIV